MHAGTRLLGWLALVACAVQPVAAADAPASERAGVFAALRAADMELAGIGYRLVTANAALCDQRQPTFGMPLQAITQYDAASREDARAVFGFAALIAVEGVVPGGAAERAGVRAGDSIVAIDGMTQPTLAQAGPAVSTSDRDAVQATLDRGAGDRPLALRILRGGAPGEVTVTPVAGCRAAFEVLLGGELKAQSDDVRVQIGGGYFDRFDADAIAVVAAHELAHIILRHPAQLRRARGCHTLAAETRRTEAEADRLSVYLLANAGYDPLLPVRFWRGPGVQLERHGFDTDHGDPAERAAALTAAAAAVAAGGAKPLSPPDFRQLVARVERPGC